MRPWAAMLGAGVMLAGCVAEPSPEEAAAFQSGLDAYNAGRRDVLQTSIAALAPDDGLVAVPCSSDGVAALRRAAMRAVLKPLDHSQLFSISPEGRLLYMTRVRRRGGVEAAPLEACNEPDLMAIAQHLELRKVLRSYDLEAAQWRADLQAELGAQFEPRMGQAAAVLSRNRITPRRLANAGA